jgi:hypothetical protein
MLWLIGAVGVFTVLGFVGAITASQIMAAVHGTSIQSDLEGEIKQSWNRVESWLGYHPMNHRVWQAMVQHPSLPSEVRGKQRVLLVILILQTVIVLAAMAGIIAITWLR